MTKEPFVEKNERIENPPSLIPLSEVMRIASENGLDKLRPNKIPEWMQHIMARAQGNGSATPTTVKVMVNPLDNVERDGVVVRTEDLDRETKITGYDVVWKDWNKREKKTVLMRVPLSRIRGDQIRLADEEYQRSPTAKGKTRSVLVSDAEGNKSITQAERTAIGL